MSVYSKDSSIKLTGEEIGELIDSLKEVGQGLEILEKEGIPINVGEILLKKDASFYRRDFSDEESMQAVRRWFETLKAVKVESHFDPIKKEYWLEVDLPSGKVSLDSKMFENPLLQKCFIAYPRVKKFAEGKSYVVIRNKRTIGEDIPWHKVVELLEKSTDRSGFTLQRYKGLGEMSAEQLWDTTMNPETRTLLQVNVEDPAKADRIFHVLMGDEVPPRKAFIQAHAKSVKNLDI
ncbi:MAG: hypothetical protein GH159_02675 [Dehalococcoidia bacterium]|nr:hypothetical protein [Dehalococcoidia bacterium]